MYPWRFGEMPSISKTWGTEAEERRRAFPCDDIISTPDEILYRAVTINASAETVFRWLCQLRAAPYSYDWIDNGGQQSPAKLTPGLNMLDIGQDVMRIFTLNTFETNRHLTLRLKTKSAASKTFGDIGVSYVVVPLDSRSPSCCRLLVKLVANYPRGLYGRMLRALLPWGDLIMMRRQLLNLKRLAEGTEQGKYK
jgi:hypothetical protein